MTITPIFRWYDFWVGLFWDRRSKTLYLFPIPMLGLKFCFWKASDLSELGAGTVLTIDSDGRVHPS